jgi:hypothetical protein
MKLIYLPAINQGALRTNWAITPLNWMDPRLQGTRAYHPYALTSFWYWWKQRFRMGTRRLDLRRFGRLQRADTGR